MAILPKVTFARDGDCIVTACMWVVGDTEAFPLALDGRVAKVTYLC